MKPVYERTPTPSLRGLTIRWHATGGSGAATAAKLLAEAVVALVLATNGWLISRIVRAAPGSDPSRIAS